MKIGSEIDVWLLRTDRAEGGETSLEESLDQAERETAAKFLRSELRRRFVLRRGGLRKVLAGYLGIAPGEVQLQSGALGKPGLKAEHQSELKFNLSHSGDLAAVAVCRGSQIGIDVERVRWMENATGIVENFFSSAEKSAFALIPEAERNRSFLRAWACKEAYLKATGEGLSFPLHRVETLQAELGAPWTKWRVEGRPTETSKWTLRELDLGETFVGEFVGALVVEGGERAIRTRELVL